MFTGIIADRGIIKKITPSGKEGLSLTIETQNLDLADVSIGDSIATNGVCLTVTSTHKCEFTADVSHETFKCTNISLLSVGSYVHLEKALQISGRLDGHIVTGHVDGIGDLVSVSDHGSSKDFTIKIPNELQKYIARKGSIALDGISLTINDVTVDGCIRLTIIPHTMQETNISLWKPGQKINIEVDLLARYLERQLNFAQTSTENNSTTKNILSMDTLSKNGFM